MFVRAGTVPETSVIQNPRYRAEVKGNAQEGIGTRVAGSGIMAPPSA
jgi:hypothetical protein